MGITIDTVAAATIWALDHDEYHALKVKISIDDQQIAAGGVIGRKEVDMVIAVIEGAGQGDQTDNVE